MLMRLILAAFLAVSVPGLAHAAGKSTKDMSMISADQIKGAAIHDTQDQKIGDVDHVVVDQATGRAKYVVVGVGGFLGIGTKDVAVPWDRLQPSDKDRTYVLNTDKQTLENAPAVDMKNLQALSDPGQQRQITAFWDKAGLSKQQAQTPSERGSGEHQRGQR